MRVRRRLLPATALLLAVGLSGGCGTFAEEYPPTGVDQLAIPTPSPDPRDFVAELDNPWLAVEPGEVWTYQVTAPGVSTVRTVTVLPVEDVAGVPATPLRSERDGVAETDYYAQDEAGNVWWVGHDGPAATWRAGEAGAQAGLAMPAEPRFGDGYRLALVPDVVEDAARVAEVDDDEVTIEVSSPVDPGLVTRETYRRGIGLVSRITGSGEAERLRSVSPAGR